MSDLHYRALLVVVYLCLLNFVVFVIGDFVIRGDAINGKVVGEHFYLGDHGRFIEVSKDVYTYSLWHAVSLFFTHPLAMLTWYIANKERNARKLRRTLELA
jgi:hypothetical protein